MVTSFFDLPLEIRLQIYRNAFNRYNGFSQNNPTLVCRQMRQETLPILFAADTNHKFQLDGLVHWIHKAPRSLLPAVRDMGIRWGAYTFQQIKRERPWSVDQIVDYANSLPPVEIEGDEPMPATPSKPNMSSIRSKLVSAIRRSDQPPQSLGIVPEGNTIEKAIFCFHAIRNTQKVWINLDNSHPGRRAENIDTNYAEEQQLALDIMSVTLVDVRELSVFSNLVHLEFLRRFKEVRQLRLTGYSKSTPEELLSIFRSMENLQSLILYRYPKTYDTANKILTMELQKYHSLTPEVLSGMRPLKYIWISHMEGSLESPYLTTSFIQALHAHVEKIKFLRVGSDYAIDTEAFEALVDFIVAASQRNLRKIELRFKVPEPLTKKLPSEVFPYRTESSFNANLATIDDISHILAFKQDSSRES